MVDLLFREVAICPKCGGKVDFYADRGEQGFSHCRSCGWTKGSKVIAPATPEMMDELIDGNALCCSCTPGEVDPND